MTIEIDGRLIGHSQRPYIIAELSANHNGAIDRAIETIERARRCGADAIKLQTYSADTMTIDCDLPDFRIHGGLWNGFTLYDLYKWAQTPFEWHASLFEHARRQGITIFSTPFDETAVDLLEDLNTPAYKVASFEVTDLPLISYIASTRKPIIMSTGMATEAEIDEAVMTARDAGCDQLVLLHCISSYPAPIEQSNLMQIRELERRFGALPGLSDHTIGTTASVAAVALGACVIEKHFTLCRQEQGPDSAFSIEPEELERLVRDARDAWSALGVPGFARHQAEEASKAFRRSLYFIKDLAAGSIITADDIRRSRPGMGLAPNYFDSLIGRRLKVPVVRGTATRWDHFET